MKNNIYVIDVYVGETIKEYTGSFDVKDVPIDTKTTEFCLYIPFSGENGKIQLISPSNHIYDYKDDISCILTEPINIYGTWSLNIKLNEDMSFDNWEIEFIIDKDIGKKDDTDMNNENNEYNKGEKDNERKISSIQYMGIITIMIIVTVVVIMSLSKRR